VQVNKIYDDTLILFDISHCRQLMSPFSLVQLSLWIQLHINKTVGKLYTQQYQQAIQYIKQNHFLFIDRCKYQ